MKFLSAVPYAFKAKYEGQKLDYNSSSKYLRISNGNIDINGNLIFIDSTNLSSLAGGTNQDLGLDNISHELSLTNSTTTVNLAPYINTDEQEITNFTINPADSIITLTIEDGNTKTINLSSYLSGGSTGGGTDNQDLDSAILDNTSNILTLYIEGGSSTDVNLSSLKELLVPGISDGGKVLTWNSNSNSWEAQTINDADWFNSSGAAPISINDDIYTLGKVGIGAQTGSSGNVNAKLHVINQINTTHYAATILNSTMSGKGLLIQNSFPSNNNFVLQAIGGNNEGLTVLGNGKVGIGIASPQETLDVNGKIRMQHSTVIGYIPVSDANGVMTWTDPSTLGLGGSSDWLRSGGGGPTATSSDNMYRTGNVTIGGAIQLGSKLYVNSNSIAIPYAASFTQQSTGAGSTTLLLAQTSASGKLISASSINGGGLFTVNANGKVEFEQSSNTTAPTLSIINNNLSGNVSMLFQSGATSTNDDYVIGHDDSEGAFIITQSSSALSAPQSRNRLVIKDNSGHIGIGTTAMNNNSKLEIHTNTPSTNPLYVGQDDSNPYLVVKGTGNVGIGTSSPSEKLEVKGTIKIDNLNDATELNRTSTGDADLIPVAYGKIKYSMVSTLSLIASSVNVSTTLSVNHLLPSGTLPARTQYNIGFTNFQYSNTNYITIITPSDYVNGSYSVESGNSKLRVYFYDNLEHSFNFIIYKK